MRRLVGAPIPEKLRQKGRPGQDLLNFIGFVLLIAEEHLIFVVVFDDFVGLCSRPLRSRQYIIVHDNLVTLGIGHRKWQNRYAWCFLAPRAITLWRIFYQN